MSTRSDWESPTGVERARPRLLPGRYVYHGDVDEHLLTQSCEVLENSEAPAPEVTVVFNCGCRARVRRQTLTRA